MTIHHATLAKAAKLGIVMTQLPDSDVVQAHWTDRNKRGFASNSAGAPKLLDDMKLWKMITLEYPQLKVTQDKNYVWSISLRKDVIGEMTTLADAWQMALDVLEPNAAEEDNDADEVGDIADDAEQTKEDLDAQDDGEDEEEGGKSVIKRKYKVAYKTFHATCGDELSQLISKHVKTAKGDDGKPRIDPALLERFARANDVWNPDYNKLNVGMRRMNVANRLRSQVDKHDYQIKWVK